MDAGHTPTVDPVLEFLNAMRAAGLEPSDQIEADGQLHRFPTNAKPGDGAGWYLFHLDNLRAGTFNSWRAGVTETWDTKPVRRITGMAELQ